jgi:cystathionine gamma-synthase
MHIETIAVHAGRAADPASGAVTPSITLSTTFERAPDGTFPSGFTYTRSGNPNRAALEAALAALEDGAAAFAFASGMAAVDSALRTLQPGDHLLLGDDLYHGVRHLVKGVYAAWGVTSTFVDMTDLDAVRAALRPNTRAVWVETPSNPALKIVDVEAISAIAHDAGAWCGVDNTWATSVCQRPLELGADLVMHSTTKYIGGHSDVLGGCLVLRDAGEMAERIAAIQRGAGAVPAPFDCWLLLRSLSTLPVRIRAQSQSAGRIAAFLADHPAVARVHYPGLPSHPGHAIAARQMHGFGAMLSFEVHGGREEAFDVVNRLALITRATSLGGVESLIEHRRSIEGDDSPTPESLLRLSVGLEHVDDLIQDLRAALR